MTTPEARISATYHVRHAVAWPSPVESMVGAEALRRRRAVTPDPGTRRHSPTRTPARSAIVNAYLDVGAVPTQAVIRKGDQNAHPAQGHSDRARRDASRARADRSWPWQARRRSAGDASIARRPYRTWIDAQIRAARTGIPATEASSHIVVAGKPSERPMTKIALTTGARLGLGRSTALKIAAWKQQSGAALLKADTYEVSLPDIQSLFHY
jgi:hypothetical protein